MVKVQKILTKTLRIKRALKEGREGKVISQREARQRKWLLRQLIIKFQGKCDTCGVQVTVKDPKDSTYATVRHVVPLSAGGDDKIKNTALTCRDCNDKQAYEQ